MAIRPYQSVPQSVIPRPGEESRGVWENPYNGANWNILVERASDVAPTADLWFSQYPSNQFSVDVLYEDTYNQGATVTAP